MVVVGGTGVVFAVVGSCAVKVVVWSGGGIGVLLPLLPTISCLPHLHVGFVQSTMSITVLPLGRVTHH